MLTSLAPPLVLAGILVAFPGNAQPLPLPPVEETIPKPLEILEYERLNKSPFYTAFLGLARPLSYVEFERPDGSKGWEQIESDTAPIPPLPELATDAPALRKVRYEQVREGLDYVSRMNEKIPRSWHFQPSPWVLRESVSMTAEMSRVGAEFEGDPAKRARWYEARVRTLKEKEWEILLKAVNGGEALPKVNFVLFARLQSEAELLKLLDEVKQTGAVPVPFPMLPPQPPGVVRPARAFRRVPHPDATYTAFPDLKLRIIVTKPSPTATVSTWSYRFVDDPVPLPLLPVLPPDASPLRRVKREQVLEGLAYLHTLDEKIRSDNWDMRFFDGYLETATDTFRRAAALEAHPSDRVGWYEARVRKMKEFELFIETQVNNGRFAPPQLSLVRYRRFQAEAELLELLGEVKATGSGTRLPVNREAVAFKGTRPFFTAFPELKPPTVVIREEKRDDGETHTIVEEKDAVSLPLPVLAPNAPPLRKVQFEQVNAGLRYLAQMNEVIRIGSWYSGFLDPYLEMALTTYRVSAELGPTPAERISWREAGVRRLKGFEQFIETRVKAGTDPPLHLALVRVHRLQAEVELLELKAQVDAGTVATTATQRPLCDCQPVCPRPLGGLLPRRFRWR